MPNWLSLPKYDAKGLARFEHSLMRWLHNRMLERIMRRCGGIQQCPWCKQCAQMSEGSYFDSSTDPTIDALHCGNCGGVSRWRFEHGMMPLDPIGLAPPPVAPAPAPQGELREALTRLRPPFRVDGFNEVLAGEDTLQAMIVRDDEPGCASIIAQNMRDQDAHDIVALVNAALSASSIREEGV